MRGPAFDEDTFLPPDTFYPPHQAREQPQHPPSTTNNDRAFFGPADGYPRPVQGSFHGLQQVQVLRTTCPWEEELTKGSCECSAGGGTRAEVKPCACCTGDWQPASTSLWAVNCERLLAQYIISLNLES